MHPSTEHLMQFFKYDHLPERLREISKLFSALAYEVADLPPNPETSACLRKLLEAKDCAVRAKLSE